MEIIKFKSLGTTEIFINPNDCWNDKEGNIFSVEISNEVILQAAEEIRERFKREYKKLIEAHQD